MSISRQRSVNEVPRALLCTSNGVGLGHVTRMMAIGRALEPSMQSVLFTLSAALPIPTRAGFTTEHLASAHQFDADGYSWNDLLSERVDQLISASTTRMWCCSTVSTRIRACGTRCERIGVG